MGFFDLDFLMGPQGAPQGGPKSDLEVMQDASKRIKEAQAKRATEGESKFMRERSKARDFALKEALKASERAFVGTPEARKEFQTKLKAADPKDYSRMLEGQAKLWTTNLDFLDSVDDAVRQYNKLSRRPEAASVEQRIGGQDVESLRREAAEFKSQREGLESDLPLEPSERSKKKLQERIDVIKGSEREREAKIGGIQGRLGVTPTPGQPAGTPAPVRPPVAPASMDDALRGFNLPRRDMSKAVNDMAKETAQKTGKPIDMNAPINARAALQTLLQTSPEFADTMARWAKAEKAKAQQPQGKQVKADEGAGLEQAQLDLEMNRLQIAQKRQQMFDSRPFQSWHAVLAFAILAILSDNPGLVFQLFTQAGDMGQLEGWIEDLQNEGKFLEERVLQERKAIEDRRAQAAKASTVERHRAEDQAAALYRDWYRSRIAVQEAADKAKGTEMEDVYKKGIKEFDQVSAEIGKVLQILTADDFRVTEEQKAWAQREFQRLYPRMEQLRKTFGITGQ